VGLLDSLLSQMTGGQGGGQQGSALGSLASLVASNPQILSAAASLLSSKDTSVGGNAGLAGLVQAFQGKGLGDIMASWVGGGPNQAISPGQLTDALGPQTLNEFATKAGIGTDQAGSVLAGLLPVLVNQVTPQGQVPETNSLESALGGLLSSLTGR